MITILAGRVCFCPVGRKRNSQPRLQNSSNLLRRVCLVRDVLRTSLKDVRHNAHGHFVVGWKWLPTTLLGDEEITSDTRWTSAEDRARDPSSSKQIGHQLVLKVCKDRGPYLLPTASLLNDLALALLLQRTDRDSESCQT